MIIYFIHLKIFYSSVRARLRKSSDSQIASGTEKEFIIQRKMAGRRGTVHGSQMYTSAEGLCPRRRTEDYIGRTTNINSILATAKSRQEMERKVCLMQ